MFSLQDNYPLSLGKFFRKRSYRLNHNRLHKFLALWLSILVNRTFLGLRYPFLDFGQPFNVSSQPF